MPKYELINTVPLSPNTTIIHNPQLPELVHLKDPATWVMVDFRQERPINVLANLSMTDALNEMKIQGVHFLLVKSEDTITGLLTSEDILGAKPIQIIQERRIPRDLITVNMLMTSVDHITAFNLRDIHNARVGNVVSTLQHLHRHYALVIDDEHSNGHKLLCGMFSTWQISRQLHMDLTESIEKAKSIAELQKRKK